MNNKTRYLVMTALFAALTFVAMRINIPIGFGGHMVHVGDSMIYLASCILPMPYAMASAAIGGGLCDILTPGAFMYAPYTIIIKAIMAGCFTNTTVKMLSKRNVIAIFVAGILGVFGYYIADVIMTGNFIAGIMPALIGVIQPIGSGIVFVVVAGVFDGARVKVKFGLK